MAAENYQSFLLKLWLRGEMPAAGLLVSLENTRTGEQRSFTKLDDLLAYLSDLTSAVDGPPEVPRPRSDL